MTFPLRQRGSILCGTRFTKSGQEPECGHETAMFSGRVVYILGSLQVGIDTGGAEASTMRPSAYKSLLTILAFHSTPMSLISRVRRAPSGSPA